MPVNKNSMVALGVPAPLAIELAAQMNGGTKSAFRLQQLGVASGLARELVTQMTAGVFDVDNLSSLGMVPALSAYLKAGGEAPSPSATILLAFGNSHGGGRALFLGGETRDPRIFQWTQAGALEQLSATARYTFDQQVGGSFNPATQISPMLWFANRIAEDDGLGVSDRIVVVPHNKNATAFADGTWTAGGAPANSLGVGVARANAAIAALKAQGYLIKEVILAHHSANPDYDSASNWDQRRVDYDAAIAYVRANVTPADDSAFVPAIFGCGMGKAELDAEPLVNRPYQAALASTNMRNVRAAVMDHVNVRYGHSAGVPVALMPDGIHEDYAGLITMGDIWYEGLLRARASANPRGAITGLSFLASSLRLWDFRTGGSANMAGAAGNLTRVSNTQPPAFEFDAALDEYALFRATSGSSSTQLPFLSNAALPASYTKWMYIKPDSIAASMGFIGDTDSASAAQHRFFYSQATNELRGGHGATQNNVAITSASTLFTAGTYHLVVLSYDNATGVMNIHIDATKATAAAVPAHAATRNGFIGFANAAGGLPFVGSIAAAGVFDKALSDAEVAELRTACLDMLA